MTANQEVPKQKVLSVSDKEAIQKSAQMFQSGVDKVRDGRTTVRYKLFDLYHDWFNNLMSVSITLGTALTALSTVPDFGKHVRLPYFWTGVGLLICNGIYILLFKKRELEKESVKAAAMGYEEEYYLLLLRNRTQDVVKGKPIDPNELVATKDILITKTTNEIDASNQETRRIDYRMDISLLTLMIGLVSLVLSTVKNEKWLIIGQLVSLIILIAFFFFFRYTSKEARNAIAERDQWLEKIKSERLREQ